LSCRKRYEQNSKDFGWLFPNLVYVWNPPQSFSAFPLPIDHASIVNNPPFVSFEKVFAMIVWGRFKDGASIGVRFLHPLSFPSFAKLRLCSEVGPFLFDFEQFTERWPMRP